MSKYYETMSNDRKSFDWDSLPPGEYKYCGSELILIGDERKATDIAADHLLAVLRKLM
jgi:hypothetical protein